VVKIAVLRAYGKKIVVAGFGGVAVAVDEHGNAVRVKDGAAETAAKWGKRRLADKTLPPPGRGRSAA
jgi:galactokinase